MTANTDTVAYYAEREIADLHERNALHAALDAALDPHNTRFIADYYKGHLSYVNMISELGDEIARRVFANMQRIVDAKR